MRDLLLLIVVLAIAALVLGATTDLMPKPVTQLSRQIAYGGAQVIRDLGLLFGLHNEYFLLGPKE